MTNIEIQSDQEIAKSCVVSYDTIELNAKLSYTEINEIFSVIGESNFYPNKNYRYVFHDKERGFTLKMQQHDSARRTQYTAKITIHRAFYESSSTGYIFELINIYREKWCIKSLDLAFDFLSSKNNSVTVKHHLNVKAILLTDFNHHVTTYTGSLKNSYRAGARLVANYDRNEREQSRDGESNYTFANRLEVRMTFKTNEIMFDSLFTKNNEQAHSIISKRLEVLLFIVDIDNMKECSAYLKRSFRAIQRDSNKINEYKKRKKNTLIDEIKRVAKLNRFNFELAYQNNMKAFSEHFNHPMNVDTAS